jgi:hypothetical protein
MPRITLRGAIMEVVMSRQVTGENDLFFPSNSVRLLMGSSKEDEKISVDDIVGFLTHFSVSRAIKDYVMEAGPLGQPQRPILAKKNRECDHDAVQVAVEVKILCCGAKQNYHYV